jgi:hypothetical protein
MHQLETWLTQQHAASTVKPTSVLFETWLTQQHAASRVKKDSGELIPVDYGELIPRSGSGPNVRVVGLMDCSQPDELGNPGLDGIEGSGLDWTGLVWTVR